jgi:hypothetical protein
MKLSRFLSLILTVTFLSLLYVYQQTEVFRLAYVGQKKHVLLEELLDKNSVLRYNIKKYASLVEIGDKVAKNNDFQMPDTYRLVRMVPTRSGLRLNDAAPGRQTLLSRFFGAKLQAEAKTVNP